MTHLERNNSLISEGAKMARAGCFIDFDICELDLEKIIPITSQLMAR